jgi:hypothetical protein
MDVADVVIALAFVRHVFLKISRAPVIWHSTGRLRDEIRVVIKGKKVKMLSE